MAKRSQYTLNATEIVPTEIVEECAPSKHQPAHLHDLHITS